MNKIIKSIATPLTIITSLIVLGTGLFMYFAFKNHLIEDIHAQIGLAMVVGTILHLVVNWRPFVNHLKKKNVYLLIIPALAVVLVNANLQGKSEGKMNPGVVFRQLEKANIRTLSELFEQAPEETIQKMQSQGLVVNNPETSLKDVAVANGKEPRELLSFFMKREGKRPPQ